MNEWFRRWSRIHPIARLLGARMRDEAITAAFSTSAWELGRDERQGRPGTVRNFWPAMRPQGEFDITEAEAVVARLGG